MKDSLSLADTDLCVMCGMCTPHCPTYQVYKKENESPRGRIALMQALAHGNITATKDVVEHLNHCLGCLACEQMCPSKVPFGKLIDTCRQRFTATNQSLSLKTLLFLNKQKQGLDYYSKFMPLLKYSGLKQLFPRASFVRSFFSDKQSKKPQLDNYYPATTNKRGSVGLFKGCMTTLLDINTLHDAITFLTQTGFDVYLPEAQYCCGALYQHNGHILEAKKLSAQNKSLFDQYEIDNIIYITSGCGSQIQNSQHSVPVIDLVSFILSQQKIQSTKFKPLIKKALIHQGCRGKNELNLHNNNLQLMKLIPDLETINTALDDMCCGAGGGNLLNYPELANQLLDPKLKFLEEINPDYLISENLGCSQHFQHGIKTKNLTIETLHPISLLVRQMV